MSYKCCSWGGYGKRCLGAHMMMEFKPFIGMRPKMTPTMIASTCRIQCMASRSSSCCRPALAHSSQSASKQSRWMAAHYHGAATCRTQSDVQCLLVSHLLPDCGGPGSKGFAEQLLYPLSRDLLTCQLLGRHCGWKGRGLTSATPCEVASRYPHEAALVLPDVNWQL